MNVYGYNYNSQRAFINHNVHPDVFRRFRAHLRIGDQQAHWGTLPWIKSIGIFFKDLGLKQLPSGKLT